MEKLIIPIVALVVLGIMAMPTTAQMRMRGEYGRGSHYNADITKLSGLNLTNEQSTKLNALCNVHLSEIKPLQDQMYNKSIELKGLWLEQTPDRNKIALLQKEIQTLRNEMFEKVRIYRMEAMNILTAQQQSMLNSYKRKLCYGSDECEREQGITDGLLIR
jgi:Spy/CpxP family protein refolding chaperone